MSDIPNELLYTEDHEYLKPEGDDVMVVGITDYAQGELGDVVYVELPKLGTTLEAHHAFNVVRPPTHGAPHDVQGTTPRAGALKLPPYMRS